MRLHRAVYDHLQGFQYSSSGVVSVMFDVQEYRKCVAQFARVARNIIFWPSPSIRDVSGYGLNGYSGYGFVYYSLLL